MNFEKKDAFEVALDHKQDAFCRFLDNARLSAGSPLPDHYARYERDFDCQKRKRRRRRREQVQGARLSLNESAGAMEVLKAEEAEEWTQLEGYYLKQGLALATIARMKKKRSMY